jgi:hypothetical protein
MKCPACDGKCWVDSQHKGPSVCPVCKGSGSVVKPTTPIHDKEGVYDQDSIWTELANSTPQDFNKALEIAVQVLTHPAVKACTIPYSFIVHLLFDKSVTPQGNLILDQITRGQLRTGQQQEKLSEEHLRARGYSVLPNGDVQTVNDIPVGPFYNTLVEWGVERHAIHRMDRPIKIDVNRKGNPFFMDNNMVAFGATYSDVDWVKASLELLNIYCTEGVAEKPEFKSIGRIVNLKLFFLTAGI